MWGRYLAAALVIAIVFQTQGAAVGAPGLALESATAGGPRSDGVPERWVLGLERIEGQTLTVAERLRVLPGARLEVTGSTLTFPAHAAGLTGIVAEPGSELAIVGSTLHGDEGAFLLHAEGGLLIDQSTIRGAARVVAQPRSLTDHVDDLLGAQLERRVPGWRLARTLTNATALLRGSLLEGPGPALVAGVPVQYDAGLPAALPALRVVDSTLRATGAGDALVCYAARQTPDPDFGIPIPVLAGEEVTRLELVNVMLQATTGAALHCPPAPAAAAIPARNLPLLDPAVAAPLNAALPPPPSPEAEAGPALVVVQRGIWTGQGPGALLDGVAKLDVMGTHFQALAPAILLVSDAAGATLLDATGSGLAGAFEVRQGSLAVTGGDFAGTGPVGAHVGGGARAAALTGAALRGFDVSVATNGAATLDGVTLEGARHQCVKVEANPTVVRDSTLRSCGIGVHLLQASGATVQGNGFLDNLDPLRVESPGPSLAHFQHAVAANTVNGRALSYLVQASGVAVADPVGHVVAAFSDGVAYADLEFRHGRHQVVASTDVVFGATTENTPGLLAAVDPGALQAWQRAGPGIRFEMYPGALRGPQGALDEGVGNDLDQAWALVELLRAQGRVARFVDGTFRVDAEAYLNWVHMEDPGLAFGMEGFRGQWFGPHAVMERTWVEMDVPGLAGLRVALDPAFEQYEHVAPLDIGAAAGVDLVAPFNHAGDESIQADYGTHSVAAIDWDAALDAFEANNATVVSFAQANALTDRDLLGGSFPRAVAPEEEPTERTATSRHDSVPVAKQWSVRLRSGDGGDAEIDFWDTAPNVYGKKLTLESDPSDAGEADELRALGGEYQAARSLIEMTTYLYVGDDLAAADGAVRQADGTFLLPGDAAERTVHRHPGDLVDFVIEARMPGNVTWQVKNSPIRVGGQYAIALEIGRVSAPLMQRLSDHLEESLQLLGHGPTTTSVPNHMLTGQLTHFQGLAYFGSVRGVTEPLARRMGVVAVPGIGIAMTGTSLNPHTYFNASQGRYIEATHPTPPYIDVQGREFAYPADGNESRAAHYLFMATMHGSNLEDKIFAGLYATPSVSTVKVLNVANAQGKRLYHLNASEAADVMPQLGALPLAVRQSIADAVDQGMDVITPGEQVTYLNWTGVGWIEYDTETGASGFLIYGGTAPPTNSGAIVPQLLSGGSGAQFVLFSDNPGERFDWGYLYGDETWFDWSVTGFGALLDWGEASTFQDFMQASKQYRGIALNNAQRGLAGALDTPGASAKFFGKASLVLTIGLDAIEIADVWINPQGTTTDRIVTTAGLVAVDAAELAVGGWAIAQGAGLGAAIGGAIGDGPGVVIGAVVGGLGAAFATGAVFGGIKKFLFG